MKEARGYHDQAYGQRNEYADQAIGEYQQAGGDPSEPKQANDTAKQTHDQFYGMTPS